MVGRGERDGQAMERGGKSSVRRTAKRSSGYFGLKSKSTAIAGSPNDLITRTLSLDLERRGFIVYVVVGTVEEEQIVHNESRVDIRPLNIDITDVTPLQSLCC